jgi:hypothetical protein
MSTEKNSLSVGGGDDSKASNVGGNPQSPTANGKEKGIPLFYVVDIRQFSRRKWYR